MKLWCKLNRNLCKWQSLVRLTSLLEMQYWIRPRKEIKEADRFGTVKSAIRKLEQHRFRILCANCVLDPEDAQIRGKGQSD
jgi:hypothetical protein